MFITGRVVGKSCKIALILMSFFVATTDAVAHGERAQQAGLRMRAVQWFDTKIEPLNVKINEEIRITGKFVPSKFWPEHMKSPADAAFLNVGVPGPTFIRIDSRVNGVPMIRSTSFELGKTYNYEMRLKARKAGRYHVHTVLSVEGTGPVIGPGAWVEVGGNEGDFENTIKTLTGDTIDLETYGMSNIVLWSAIWFGVGLAWFIYWLLKCPIIVPRFKMVARLGDKADEMITNADKKAAAVFLGLTLFLIGFGYFWAQEKYPITTPLQTGKVHVPHRYDPGEDGVDVEVVDARYRIPGRSFELTLRVKNKTDQKVQLGNFTIANVRFINPKVLKVKPVDSHDLVASAGLRVDDGLIDVNETKEIKVFAEDALWETYRLTSLIYDPDSRFAGMLFFFGDRGDRFHTEVGGPMLPVFM